jgi:2'-5' RNA ligase
LRIAFGRFERFALEIGRGGAFPSTRRARVLWLGATAEGDLAGVQGESAKAAETVLELPAEERSFHPHVTIARCRQPWRRTDVERWTAAVPLSFAGSFVVAEGVLVRSVLGPRGADYSVIERFPLAGESP